MDKHRLINCDFLTKGPFLKVSNKAKLLYFLMIINADDRGFVNNTDDIIELLTNKEIEEGNVSLKLLNNDYTSALVELEDKGFLYWWDDKYGNRVYLIRHWFIHNKWKSGLHTNYGKFLYRVELKDYKYYLKEKETLKENKDKIKQNNLNEINLNEIKSCEPNQEISEVDWANVLKELDELDTQDEEDMKGE